MSFQADIAKFAEKAGESLDKTVRLITMDLFGSIIHDTPVDEGRLRGNWQTTRNTPATGEIGLRSEEEAIAELKDNCGGAGSVTYMTNNLPYARSIEEGHAKKHPEGMARKNFARVEGLVSSSARKNKV